MNCFMGIDIGSQNSKGVIIDDEALLAKFTCASGINYRSTAEKIRQALLAKVEGHKVLRVAATGYGTENVPFADDKVTDVQCSARGIFHFDDSVRTLIEIGARSSRVIRLGPAGQVINFSMNNRCAAGGGVFLQVIANVLRVDLSDIGSLSLKSKNPIRFNTGCAVFGETEAITRICEGFSKEDILAGAHRSLGEKITGMVKGVGLEEKCAVVGGGGLNPGLVKSIGELLKTDLIVPPQPEVTGALGAAILAKQRNG